MTAHAHFFPFLFSLPCSEYLGWLLWVLTLQDLHKPLDMSLRKCLHKIWQGWEWSIKIVFNVGNNFLLLHLFIHMGVCMSTHTHLCEYGVTHVEVRGQLARVIFLFLSCGSGNQTDLWVASVIFIYLFACFAVNVPWIGKPLYFWETDVWLTMLMPYLRWKILTYFLITLAEFWSTWFSPPWGIENLMFELPFPWEDWPPNDFLFLSR